MHSDRQRTRLYLIVEGVLFLLCLLGAYHTALKADLGLSVQRKNGALTVREIHFPAAIPEIQEGDILRSIQGNAVSSQEDIEFLLDGMAIGDVALLELDRDLVPRIVSARLVPYYNTRYLVIQFLVGCLFFFAGMFVFLRRPRDDAAFVLHWAFITVAIVIFTTWGRYSIEPQGLGYVLRLVFSAAYAFMPVLFAHFALFFPRRKFPAPNRILLPLYLVSTALTIWMGATFYYAMSSSSVQSFHRFMTAFDVCRVFFSSCVVFGILTIVHSYRTAEERSERKKLRWLMAGLVVTGLSFISLWQIPQMLTSHGLIDEDLILLLSSVMPITFVIAVLRYHVMDIDFILNRSTVYAVVIIVLLAVYIAVVGIIGGIVGSATATVSFSISAGAAVVIALLFEPARIRVQRFVDKSFFRVQYDIREAERRCIDGMKHSYTVNQLAEFVVQQITAILSPERIGFFVLHDEGSRLRLLAHEGFRILEQHGVPLRRNEIRNTLRLPIADEAILEPGVAHEPVMSEDLSRWGIVVTFAMLSETAEPLGFLVLGRKKSGARYSMEDIDLLTTVAVQAGLAIERIELQKKLVLEHAEAQRLEELNRLKSYFVSSVSHDLKTPLTSIRMFAEMLRSGKSLPFARVREYLDIIEGESERLTRLINNVLDFARVERGIKEYHFDEVQLNALVRGVLKSMRYQLTMERFTVKEKLRRAEMIVQADADAVAEALINLLSNAMKYSRDKRSITVSTFRKDRTCGIQVQDRGIGIPSDELEKIFEPFYRQRDGIQLHASGAGLGLALVKHIMEAHKGSITVESRLRRGSIFTLIFPLEVL